MSDRHIVQKKFNSVFQDYRASVLPNVVGDEMQLMKIFKVILLKYIIFLWPSFPSWSC